MWCSHLNCVLPVLDNGFGAIVEGSASIHLSLSELSVSISRGEAGLDSLPLLSRHHHNLREDSA